MKNHLLPIAAFASLFLASCAANRTPFSPGGPTTVGMPAELSDRERTFIPEIDTALRREGMIPVRSEKGDLQLDFKMSEGPVNTTTYIALKEDDATLFTAKGRAAGVPMIGRSSVAEKSFAEAFAEFSSSLSSFTARRSSSSSTPPYGENPAPSYSDEELPVY